jgi:excisionase family DNA binding protein
MCDTLPMSTERGSTPSDIEALFQSDEPVWASYLRESERLEDSSLDIFFLAFLKRVQRFGYFNLGPLTIDVRMIEDIVERTAIPKPGQTVHIGEDLSRFSRGLMEELKRSGRNRLDDLHVLLALMKCDEGLPGRVFGELGVTPEQVEEYLKGNPTASPTPAAPVEEKLYSPEEAAEYLGVHVQTVRAWIRSGRLKASRLAGQRALRIKATDLATLLEPVDPSEV